MIFNKQRKVVETRAKPLAIQNTSSSNRKPPVLPSPPGAIRLFGSIRRLWNAVIPVVRQSSSTNSTPQPALPTIALSLERPAERKEDGYASESEASTSESPNLKLSKTRSQLRPSVTFDALPSDRSNKKLSFSQHPQPSPGGHIPSSSTHPKLPRVDPGINPTSQVSTTTRQFRRQSPTAVHPRRLGEQTSGSENYTKLGSSSDHTTAAKRRQTSPLYAPAMGKSAASRFLQNAQTRLDKKRTHQSHVADSHTQRSTIIETQPRASMFFGFRHKDETGAETSLEASDTERESQRKGRKGRKPTVREIIAEGRAAERAAKEKVHLKKLNSFRRSSATRDREDATIEDRACNGCSATESTSSYRKQSKIKDAEPTCVDSLRNTTDGGNVSCHGVRTEEQTSSKSIGLIERGQQWKEKLRGPRSKQNRVTVNQCSRNLLSRTSFKEGMDTSSKMNEEKHIKRSKRSSQSQRMSDVFEEEIREGDLSPVVRPSAGDTDLQDIWRIQLASYTRRMMEDGSRSVLSAPASPRGGGAMILTQVGSPMRRAPRSGYGAAKNWTSSPVCTTCLYKALTELPNQSVSHGRRSSLGSPVTECGREKADHSKSIRWNDKDTSTRGRLEQLYELVSQMRDHDRRSSVCYSIDNSRDQDNDIAIIPSTSVGRLMAQEGAQST